MSWRNRVSDNDLIWYLGLQRAGFETEAEIMDLLSRSREMERYRRIESAILGDAHISKRYRELATDPEVEPRRGLLSQMFNID